MKDGYLCKQDSKGAMLIIGDCYCCGGGGGNGSNNNNNNDITVSNGSSRLSLTKFFSVLAHANCFKLYLI